MYISCIGRSARVDPCGFSRDHPRTQAARSSAAREDCAKVVEFLATGLSDYVSGAVIPIDVAATVVSDCFRGLSCGRVELGQGG